jgi:conjugal transfer pilin signal peptidase TrbI
MSKMRAAIHAIGVSAQTWFWRRVEQCLSLANDIGRRWYLYLPLVVAYGWALDHVRINVSHSLPYTLVFVEHAPRDLRRGDLVVYRFAGGKDGQYADMRGAPFLKRVRGIAGDRITVEGRTAMVNGEPVGYAKPKSRDGTPLNVVHSGVIPGARFYVQGDSPDSFDSRYSHNGLIRAEQIAARARVIF